MQGLRQFEEADWNHDGRFLQSNPSKNAEDPIAHHGPREFRIMSKLHVGGKPRIHILM